MSDTIEYDEGTSASPKLVRIVSEAKMLAAPTLAEEEISHLPSNSVLEILKKSEKWFEIECKTLDTRGWVLEDETFCFEDADLYQIIDFKGTSLREEKDLDSKVVTILQGGTYVSGVECLDQFLRIDYPACGWVQMQSNKGIPFVVHVSDIEEEGAGAKNAGGGAECDTIDISEVTPDLTEETVVENAEVKLEVALGASEVQKEEEVEPSENADVQIDPELVKKDPTLSPRMPSGDRILAGVQFSTETKSKENITPTTNAEPVKKKKRKRKTMKMAAMFDKISHEAKNPKFEKVQRDHGEISAATAARKKIFEDREREAATALQLINSKSGDKVAPSSNKNHMLKKCTHCGKTLYPNDPSHYKDSKYYHEQCWALLENTRLENEGKSLKLTSGVDSSKIDRKEALKHLKDRVSNDKSQKKTICPGCGEDIWFHEREHSFCGKYYHKGCFKCSHCSKVFDKAETVYNRRREAFCCRCFNQLFQHEFAVQQFTEADMFQVSGHGMVFDEMGGEDFPLLFKGILKKTLFFVTINVHGDKWVHPLVVCPFAEDPETAGSFSEDQLLDYAENRRQLPRSTLFEDTDQEQWQQFLDNLTGEEQRLGWITYTAQIPIPETGLTMQKDTTCLIHWNPPNSDTRRQVVFSAAKDELHRLYVGGICFVAETLEDLSPEAMRKRMSEMTQA